MPQLRARLVHPRARNALRLRGESLLARASPRDRGRASWRKPRYFWGNCRFSGLYWCASTM